ncbi:DUF1800 family protein [Inhella sp.]|uniref:DUF1800 domain-containing protein n=1 Tax=Inhella sp. TaxID=1921806 RepID=UPI0035B185A9
MSTEAESVDVLPALSALPAARPQAPDTEVPALNTAAAASAAALLLSACGGGENAPPASAEGAPSTQALAAREQGSALSPGGLQPRPTRRDAARFLCQASFGPTGAAQIDAMVQLGFDAWISGQAKRPAALHIDYLQAQRNRDGKTYVPEELSYEAIWQQWLWGEDQLRARMSWALLQFFVISNIAPDLRPHAMSSYLDLLNRNAFGNFRTLLGEVSRHPAMGYYLNMLKSQKENPVEGTHPNENYPREVLQLFSIGLVKLNPDGSTQLDGNGRPIPTYDEPVIRGFARAFTGWGFGGLNTTDPKDFLCPDENNEALWQRPMEAWPAFHEPGEKLLLDGRRLPAGQTPQKDLDDALDCIFQHPNVGPFFGRQMIQRFVTSNPSPAYVARVAAAFANNGRGVRGDLLAVLRAVLLDKEARGDAAGGAPRFGKLREPVIRFAHFLRALGATSTSGSNRIHYLDSADEALGQSPLLAPSVFNFYSPFFRPAGPLMDAGMVAPEFQITSETSTAGSLNFFHGLFQSGGYGWPEEHRVRLNLEPLRLLAGDATRLVDELDLLFFSLQMSAATRQRLLTLINAIAPNRLRTRVRQALTVVALSPDFVVQH